jgi:peptidoglycan/LPS O-acetylase OafA/YrhL
MSEDFTRKETTELFVRLDFLDALRCFAIIYFVVSHLILIPQPNLAIPSWIAPLLINASLLFNLIPAHITGFIWASWTIGVMAILYLLFPLIYRWIRSLPAALILFIMPVLLSWGWSHFVLSYGEAAGYLKADEKNFALGFGFLQHLPVFVCGVLVYRLYFDYFSKLNARKRRMYGWACIIIFIPFYAVLLTDKLQNMLWGLSMLHGICLALLALGLGLKPFWFLINAKTSYIGKTTSSMYLLHTLIIFSILPVYRSIYNIFPNEMLGYFVSLFVTLAVLIPVSLASYRYIERKGSAWGKRISSKNKRFH